MILARAQYAAAIDKQVFPGTQGGPLVHVMAAKAVCFLEAMTPGFAYQKQVVVNAQALGKALPGRRLPDRVRRHGFAFDAGGCLRQGRARQRSREGLDEAYITVNKNAIPFDVNPPLNPSGVRLGSPAVTTRFLKCN
jgi:glycine hydroxymethyltransferase